MTKYILMISKAQSKIRFYNKIGHKKLCDNKTKYKVKNRVEKD